MGGTAPGGWVNQFADLNRRIETGVTVGPCNPLGLNTTSGRAIFACATAGAVVRCVGFPYASGAGTKVAGSGLYQNATLKRSGKLKCLGNTWTGGGLIYVGEVAGTLQMNAPNGSGDLVQVVGMATGNPGTDEMLVHIDPFGSINA